MADNDEEFEIDISKITNLFKRKKDKSKKIEKDIEKTKDEIDESMKGSKKEMNDLEKDEEELDEIEEDIEQRAEKIENIDKKEKELDEDIEYLKEEKEDLEKEEKKELKKIKKEEKKVSKIKEDIEESEKEDDEDISLDFSKIKNIFKKSNKKEQKETKNKEESSEEDISFDWRKTIEFFKKNKYAIPVVLILIAILFSTYFRMYPASLPITDEWAQNTVHNYYRNQVKSEIDSQFPNLPDANKNSLIENKFQEMLKTNKATVEQQIAATSKSFKSQLMYDGEDGKEHTYLLAIDPYLWFGETRNYLKNGHFGTEIVDGKDINFQRNGRYGRAGQPGSAFHLYFGVFLNKFMSILSNMPLMAVFFLIPVIIIGASIIPAFFIGRKIGGNVGGFFAAMIVAVNGALLSRTPAGFSDTDAYNIFFPLLIMWLFLEAFETTDIKKKIIYGSLSGLCVGLFSTAWGGWWYTFDFILVMIGIYFVYLIMTNLKDIQKSVNIFKKPVILAAVFLSASAIFVSLFNDINTFISAFQGPFSIITLKDVGIISLWPNVLTTVAEFNVVPLSTIIGQMGGNLLFFIGIVGIILTLIKKDKSGKIDVKYAILLTIWFLGTAYGFTKGIRFAILMVPAFAVAFGVGIGIIYEFLSRWIVKEFKINQYLTKTILIVLLCLLLISPIKAAQNIALNEVPSMNDQWYNTLSAIKNDGNDGIITSWWDFGHWFVAITERRVTFDGADQGERIHWVGKSLLTENEDVAMGILRMLNCGQQNAPHVLECYVDDGKWEWTNKQLGQGECNKVVSGSSTVKAINIINKIIVEDKDKAQRILEDEGLDKEAIKEVLELTHCDNVIPQYYIASEDMVGKSGVWAHFGSWDFNRALMWQTVRKLDYTQGIELLKNDFNLSEDDADQYYYEIKNNKGDQWISPWPSYITGKSGCIVEEKTVKCVANAQQQIPIQINLDNYNTVIPTNNGDMHPNSIVYVYGEDVKKKEFNDSQLGFSVILVPDGDSYYIVLSDPKLAYSMFTRMFYFKGHGLLHFDLLDYQRQFTGGEIYTYKVDWQGNDKEIGFEEQINEEIRASHILIMTENRTDEEALKLIENISKQINDSNFAELATKYSEDPGSAKKGGDLGWFGRGVMIPEFENTAFALKKGDVSEPIKTQFGYHIIKLIDRIIIEEEKVADNEEDVVIENTEKENKDEEISNDSSDTLTAEPEGYDEDSNETNQTDNQYSEDNKTIDFDIEI